MADRLVDPDDLVEEGDYWVAVNGETGPIRGWGGKKAGYLYGLTTASGAPVKGIYRPDNTLDELLKGLEKIRRELWTSDY